MHFNSGLAITLSNGAMKAKITGSNGHPHHSEQHKVVFFSQTTPKIWNARKKILSSCIKVHLLMINEF